VPGPRTDPSASRSLIPRETSLCCRNACKSRSYTRRVSSAGPRRWRRTEAAHCRTALPCKSRQCDEVRRKSLTRCAPRLGGKLGSREPAREAPRTCLPGPLIGLRLLKRQKPNARLPRRRPGASSWLPFVPGRFAKPPCHTRGRQRKAVSPTGISCNPVRRRSSNRAVPSGSYRNNAAFLTSRRNWLTPRPRLRTLQTLNIARHQHFATDAAASACISERSARFGAGRLRRACRGQSRKTVGHSANDEKRLKSPPISVSWVRPKLSGQLRQMSNSTALTIAVIALSEPPRRFRPASPRQYTVPKAMSEPIVWSTTTTAVSTPISAAAAMKPCQSGGGGWPH